MRGWVLLATALLALGVALMLSPAEGQAWARHQSPVSPPLLTPTQPSQAATASIQISPEPISSEEAQPPQAAGRATLIAGGIILAGLLVGAATLLRRGQPPDEPAP